MNKKSPFFTATVASMTYFITFIMLKYFLVQKEFVDWWGALTGAIVFWMVIFLVHQLLEKRYTI